jgi:hypothetical protein
MEIMKFVQVWEKKFVLLMRVWISINIVDKFFSTGETLDVKLAKSVAM